MTKDKQTFLQKEIFSEIKWEYQPDKENHHGYSSVMGSLESLAREKSKTGEKEQEDVLKLLARAASMMLQPSSINEPFKPIFQDFQEGRRSAIPDDFTEDELTFFAEILDLVENPWLKARLADLLWLCSKPKNPEHARIAIDAYKSHDIDGKTWRADIDECWSRAIGLCLQIKDYDRLEPAKNQLIAAFNDEYPDSPFMHLWLAKLLGAHNLDREILADVATKLSSIGRILLDSGDYYSSRYYFEIAATKYKQNCDEQGWLDCLVRRGESFENEAASRLPESKMIANSLYENAIQAYRKVPIKHRPTFSIEERIRTIRTKISDTGKATLGEMLLIHSPEIDIGDISKASIEHVSNRDNIENDLVYYSGLFSGPDYKELEISAREILEGSIAASIFGATHYSQDGRVVAKSSGANLGAGEDDPDNQAILHRQILECFGFEYQMVVKGQVLPALRQLLVEYRFSLPFLESICYHSPFVPADREKLTAYALWLGFEYQFANAIHLLTPQFEHCIRTKLKETGAHTSNVDKDGIENENGLSTLMDLPEAIDVFGENLVFEIKAIFTDPLGPNLRNEVAHGLLDDNSASSIGSIYAWWMILRLVVRSLAFPDDNLEEDISPNKE